MTRHEIYPSFLAPTGVPWSEYIMSQRNRSRSVSSSTEALDSDHARYITRRITQHARSMVAGTRSLPTDSPVSYFHPFERGHVSKGVPSDIGSLEGALHRSMQIPPHHFLTCPPVVLSITLESLNRTDCLLTLVLMTMILCLRLSMQGSYRQYT